jgi:hypothetical protein
MNDEPVSNDSDNPHSSNFLRVLDASARRVAACCKRHRQRGAGVPRLPALAAEVAGQPGIGSARWPRRATMPYVSPRGTRCKCCTPGATRFRLVRRFVAMPATALRNRPSRRECITTGCISFPSSARPAVVDARPAVRQPRIHRRGACCTRMGMADWSHAKTLKSQNAHGVSVIESNSGQRQGLPALAARPAFGLRAPDHGTHADAHRRSGRRRRRACAPVTTGAATSFSARSPTARWG